jgi:hypothetical protein
VNFESSGEKLRLDCDIDLSGAVSGAPTALRRQGSCETLARVCDTTRILAGASRRQPSRDEVEAAVDAMPKAPPAAPKAVSLLTAGCTLLQEAAAMGCDEVVMANAGGVAAINAAMRHPSASAELLACACGALEGLVRSGEIAATAGRAGAVESLVFLFCEPPEPRSRNWPWATTACHALVNLATLQANAERLVATGRVREVLSAMCAGGGSNAKPQAVEVAWRVAAAARGVIADPSRQRALAGNRDGR